MYPHDANTSGQVSEADEPIYPLASSPRSLYNSTAPPTLAGAVSPFSASACGGLAADREAGEGSG